MAWPGVQPSPLAGSEASTAQKPQPQPEVTPKTTLRTSPITTLGVEVSDEENSAADTDYAADMAAAQSTWDPWLVIILQPHPHFSYVQFEYRQGEVRLWASPVSYTHLTLPTKA